MIYLSFEPSEDELSRLGLTVLDNKWYSNIRKIEIETAYYGGYHPIGYDWHVSFDRLERFLAGFPHLKAITVAWQYYMEPMVDYDLPGPKAYVRFGR